MDPLAVESRCLETLARLGEPLTIEALAVQCLPRSVPIDVVRAIVLGLARDGYVLRKSPEGVTDPRAVLVLVTAAGIRRAAEGRAA